MGKVPNQNTKLGRLIAEKGVAVYKVAGACDIWTNRMTHYLRETPVPFSAKHLERLCEYFGVNPEDLVMPEMPSDEEIARNQK